MAEWVDTPKPIPCPFLKSNLGKREEMRYTFDVSKCDKLFDVLLQNNVIKLKEGHVIPVAELIAKRKYCKWHDSYSHTTNECNYFRRQIQLALNDGHLTLGENSKMKLDSDPFPVNMINFEEKRVLVRTSQAKSTKGKKVNVSDDLRHRMLKPKSPEVGIWKVNEPRKSVVKVRPGSSFLAAKYLRNNKRRAFQRLGGVKRERSPGNLIVRVSINTRDQDVVRYWQQVHRPGGQGFVCMNTLPRVTWCPGRKPVRKWTPVQRDSDAIVLCNGDQIETKNKDSGRSMTAGTEGSVVLVGAIPCHLQSEVHIGGQRIVGVTTGPADNSNNAPVKEKPGQKRVKRASGWDVSLIR